VPDPELGAPGVDRPGVSARVLALLGGAVALTLTLVVYVAYRELIHYERRAIEHVPPGAELALRVDLEQLVLFEPVRKHLLPLFDRAPLVRRAQPAGAVTPRLQRLREKAGLNLGLDLRELVFARMPDGGWVLALGGIFGSRHLLEGIEAVLHEEAGIHLRREGALLSVEYSGVVLTQADDGVLLVGSDAALLARAAPASHGYQSIGLEREGAGALAALPSWLDALRPEPAPSARASVLRGMLRLDFGDPLELALRIEHPASTDMGAARRAVAGWLGMPADADQFVPRADWGGERAVLARAHFSQASATLTLGSSLWQRSELDQAARSLAAWLEGRFLGIGPTAR
jgi:hypothetical protein